VRIGESPVWVIPT